MSFYKCEACCARSTWRVGEKPEQAVSGQGEPNRQPAQLSTCVASFLRLNRKKRQTSLYDKY